VIEQNLSVASAVVGRELKAPRVEFPCDVVAERRIGQRLAEASVGEFAILNPGAGWGAKRWPAERYGRVARALAEDGVRAIINYGPREEDLAYAAEAASDGAAVALKCSITELIALTRRARLFIGGDTGPLHLAAALQVPVVAIFGPTDPARNGPYGTCSVVLRNPASPTTHARKPQPDQGLLGISADAVVEAARGLLAEGKSGGQECPPHTDGANG
jgi:heptosyltransferase-1